MSPKRKKIVTIGGGTGSFTLLLGLKQYNVDLSAIVSMADDGGSTGVLRDELGVLPPGDVRQCLIALSESSEELRKLMTYRFQEGRLKGHNFGNLFLSALEKINGNFFDASQEAGKILKIKGEVIPVSEGNMRLCIKLKNGKVIKGEKELDHNPEIRKVGLKEIYLNPKVYACPEAIRAINQADLVVIGPGDLYGSILPNLLVGKISQAIKKSKAKVLYVANLTNKKGQTDNFTVDDYILELEKKLGKGIIDYVIFNIEKPNKKLIEKYKKREGRGFFVSLEDKKLREFKVLKSRILSKNKNIPSKGDALSSTRSLIRHDSQKLAKVVMWALDHDDYDKLIYEII